MYKKVKKNQELYTGGLSLRFMDKIGGGIDFCFIDTMHVNPGEILDFLMALPYLNANAVVVFHDTKLQTWQGFSFNGWDITNNLLVSAISGKKLIQGNHVILAEKWYTGEPNCHFPNITGIQINEETRQRLYEVFNLLTIRWMYAPTVSEEEEIINFFARYYDKYYIDYLKEVFVYERGFVDYIDSITVTQQILRSIAFRFSKESRAKILKFFGKKLGQKIFHSLGGVDR
jgi:hypothetical protein